MLAGIGGKTVAEAKENVSYAEFMAWLAYRRKRGPLNLSTRMDHGFALIATLITRGLGGKAEMTDFLPFADETELTVDSVFKKLTGANR